MDFFEGYANGVQKSFYPYNPLIVIDKFHVVQLLNRRMDAVRKRVHKEEKEKCVGTARRLKFETLRKIALFSSRMEEFQKFDSKNAEYIKSWQF